MCFFGFVTRVLVIVFGVIVPARHTQNALGEEELNAWAKYWIVYAWLICIELFGDALFSWLPLYVEAKLLVVLWVVIAAPQSSVWVFDEILDPLLIRHLPQIDELLQRSKRYLLGDAISHSSELCFRSLDTISSIVSQIWHTPSATPDNDAHSVLSTATEANNPPFPVKNFE
ncbi:putative HVA22-like protein g [Drosophila novamexicana]|uniref:putative HVA22-like protein g n=1 Tax=Drosophila novamexicana TaxID=47314 RepID=UPI0011E5A80A|nr:putative HVA22-like protein g [Drosophila novamexicana]